MATDHEDYLLATVKKLTELATTDPKLAYTQLNQLPVKTYDSIMNIVYNGRRNQQVVRKLLRMIEPKTRYLNANCDI
jgi:hypothetical protein